MSVSVREAGAELLAQHQRWTGARERLVNPAKPISNRRARPLKRAPLPEAPSEDWDGVPYPAPLPFDYCTPVVVGPSMPMWKRIAFEVASKHGLSLTQIKSNQRSKEFVAARHEVFYRCATETKLSLPHIGRLLGDKDHTTVLHGIRKHAERMKAAKKK